MNTKDKGDISEAVIFAELIKRGYVVLKPWGDNQKYDCVVDNKDTTFSRIQCKTGRLRKGTIKFNVRSSTTKNGKNTSVPYTKNDIDYIIIYCEENDSIYSIKIENCPSDTCSLRINPPKSHQKTIRIASDYNLDLDFPKKSDCS